MFDVSRTEKQIACTCTYTHAKVPFRLFSVPCFTYQAWTTAALTPHHVWHYSVKSSTVFFCTQNMCSYKYRKAKAKIKSKSSGDRIRNQQIRFNSLLNLFILREPNIIYYLYFTSVQFTIQNLHRSMSLSILFVLSFHSIDDMCAHSLVHSAILYFIRYDSLNTYLNCISFVSILSCGCLLLLFYRWLWAAMSCYVHFW